MPRLFENVIYVQIRRQWLSVQFFGWSGRIGEWAGPAEVTLAEGKNGQPILRNTSESSLLEVNPGETFTAFSHPRALIHDFDRTGVVLRYFLEKAGIKKRFKKATFVVQILDEWEGGITDIEFRALIHLCRQVGAARVLPIEASRELTPPEILYLVRGHRGDLIQCPIPIELR